MTTQDIRNLINGYNDYLKSSEGLALPGQIVKQFMYEIKEWQELLNIITCLMSGHVPDNTYLIQNKNMRFIRTLYNLDLQ